MNTEHREWATFLSDDICCVIENYQKNREQLNETQHFYRLTNAQLHNYVNKIVFLKSPN
jgi:hypothetical protein